MNPDLINCETGTPSPGTPTSCSGNLVWSDCSVFTYDPSILGNYAVEINGATNCLRYYRTVAVVSNIWETLSVRAEIYLCCANSTAKDISLKTLREILSSISYEL